MATNHEQSDRGPEKEPVVYSRVSVTDQGVPVDAQVREIERFAEKAGASVVEWYVDGESNGSDS